MERCRLGVDIAPQDGRFAGLIPLIGPLTWSDVLGEAKKIRMPVTFERASPSIPFRDTPELGVELELGVGFP